MAKISGTTIPLFSIRTKRDWGIGQISDLPRCAAWLRLAGQRLLQVLPTHELSEGETSPYGALSAFALDPIYLDVEGVADLDPGVIAATLGTDGAAELARVRGLATVDYRAVRRLKRRVLAVSFARFREGQRKDPNGQRAKAFSAFVESESTWLRDHALYVALRDTHQGYGWQSWPPAERSRAPEVAALAGRPTAEDRVTQRILEEMYLQWLLHEQWLLARAELKALGVSLMGDMPFIVGVDSADVWAHHEQFRTDVSLGAPPDDFAKEGQSWGLPVYDWEAMDKDNLAWLRSRVRRAAVLFDCFRIDHVVGFFRQWVTKPGEKGEFYPAKEDEQRARGERVLRAIVKEVGPGAVIAEDLGVIPPFVRETMSQLRLPGYKVLPWETDEHFAPRDPRGFPELSVATWSTHDTAPITSWWDELEPWRRERLANLDHIPLELPPAEREIALLKLLFSARSELTLVLVNELIGDGTRINVPGTVNDQNWTWRLPRPIEDLKEDPALASRFETIRCIVSESGREA